MPFPVAVLNAPSCAYSLLVVSLAGILYAGRVKGAFVAAFVGVCAGLLAAMAYALNPPPLVGVAAVLCGALLMVGEFTRPAYGAAGVLASAFCCAGSWTLLAAVPVGARVALTTTGVLGLFSSVALAIRRQA